MQGDTALVLLSGGADSCISLFWAKAEFKEVCALNVHYGQRHYREILAAEKVASLARVPLIKMTTDIFTQIGDSALLGTNTDEVSKIREKDNLPASFVPGRNLILFSIAAAVAYKRGISDLVGGMSQTDYSGYPDCRRHFIMSLEKCLYEAFQHGFWIYTPLMFKSKKESIFLAQTLPGCMDALKWTHTCYEGKYPPCGECPACRLRQKGFQEAGVEDPLLVRAREEGKA